MKKILLAILMVSYLSSSAGVTLRIHYCMGKPVEWKLGQHQNKKCTNCGMKETGDGCCKDENKFFKNTDDQKVGEAVYKSINTNFDHLNDLYVEILSLNFPAVIISTPISHPPPIRLGLSIYIYNRTLLI